TLDQVISYFGKPDNIHYDVRQLLGTGRINDYFDLDLYYGATKVSVKSSYFRIKARPSFIVYGKKGTFVKESKDRQEEHLKMFYMPTNKDFGKDTIEQYGVLTYIDDEGTIHEEKVKSVDGDYGRIYDDLYEVIINNKEKTIKDYETLLQLEILEKGIKNLK
ncbi:MAG: NAD(P)-dependent oxidoreductase, partial [Clostridium sartagoforme]|nr:NAD(P)-dependent oxidoreductase [Clostridium sartagoforme]